MDNGRDFHPWVPQHDSCSFWELMGWPLCVAVYVGFWVGFGYGLARFIGWMM
jgi:hypothetical protein